MHREVLLVAGIAGLLLGAVTLFWVRGRDVNLAVRRLNARLRLSGSTRLAMLGVLVLWISTAGFVYYNTQVINDYTPTRAAEERQVRYETDYKATYEGMPQPRVVDIQYEIDVYPAERDLSVRGEFLMVNRGEAPIDTLFVNLQEQVEMEVEMEVEVERLKVKGNSYSYLFVYPTPCQHHHV